MGKANKKLVECGEVEWKLIIICVRVGKGDCIHSATSRDQHTAIPKHFLCFCGLPSANRMQHPINFAYDADEPTCSLSPYESQ